jgi:hypothetical protein
MLSTSKSKYKSHHPDHEVFFNANLFTLEDGKIWYGDVDYTIEKTNLEKAATAINRDLYLLRELDGRFENEKISKDQIKKKAVKVIKPVTY